MPTLDWIGKRAVLNHHREIPFHLLKQNEALSAGFASVCFLNATAPEGRSGGPGLGHRVME